MQDFLPKAIIFLSEKENMEKVQISLNTVMEDAGTRDIRTEILEVDRNRVSEKLDTNLFHFLIERDFLMPEFGLRSSTFFHENKLNSAAIHSYWQRSVTGASEEVSNLRKVKSNIVPISALVFNQDFNYKDFSVPEFNKNFEINISTLDLDWIAGNNCVIQSNRISAYAPKVTLRKKN